MIRKTIPLPFLGQKRMWIKEINKYSFGKKVIVDLFGGSGLLAHTIKRNNPLPPNKSTITLRQLFFGMILIINKKD